MVLTWRISELMRAAGVRSATDLTQRLAEAGVSRHLTRVAQLVKGPPAQLSLELLAGLCEVLNCTPNDLLASDGPLEISDMAPGGRGDRYLHDVAIELDLFGYKTRPMAAEFDLLKAATPQFIQRMESKGLARFTPEHRRSDR